MGQKEIKSGKPPNLKMSQGKWGEKINKNKMILNRLIFIILWKLELHPIGLSTLGNYEKVYCHNEHYFWSMLNIMELQGI
jgi:hypothetical protein